MSLSAEERRDLLVRAAKTRRKLSPEQRAIIFDQGTEAPFKNKYWDCHDEGTYTCASCGLPLFSSESKYDSETGWPAFHSPIEASFLLYREDTSHGMTRREVVCGGCGGNLGHVFEDGPRPTGMRYCINSASLNLEGRK
ncbi:Peptide methionine sulfoxide reductase msrB [Giardia muris]|uniref:Peptide-methionine (R)-S-oxide reductase n=1 Tax=Giardia muris TaxID=5742 RepID=A0A3S5GR46_GIAMU|nr:Peptide methionine sulfoxide reductase msrB [Giardia muris]TNJ27776.1 Peptide methionine sulfoxide reductase msrB [Giardia muris]|eukprot:TNJ27776.1 Peptide methionine sulfoxide reductase msrB [Giardia muris]